MSLKRSRAANEEFVPGVRSMLYAFGDEYEQHPDTVSLMGQIVEEYIEEVTAEARRIAREQQIGLDVQCIMYAVRGDKRKIGRIRELLEMNKEIKEARKHNNDVAELADSQSNGNKALAEVESKQ